MAVLACASQPDLSVAFVLLTMERNEVSHSLSPASSHCATLACSHCVRSWPRGGTPRQALAHSKSVHCSTSSYIVMDSQKAPRVVLPRARWRATRNSVDMRISVTPLRPQPGVREVAEPPAEFQREAKLDSTYKWKQFTSLSNISDLAREVLRALPSACCCGPAPSMCLALHRPVLRVTESAALEPVCSRIGTAPPKSLANA